MVYVPPQYQFYVQNAADYLGIPYDVVAEQIYTESRFDPTAVSPAGAEGIAQFEPGTFSSYGAGSPFNVDEAFSAYKNYMKHLLSVEGGSVKNALAAYNAGEGNIQAGMGYATGILNNSGQSDSLTAGGGSTSSSSSTSSGNQPAQATIDPQTLAVQYGFTKAFLDANPELKKIFDQAVAGQWTTDRFTAALQGTKWFKSHSSDERTWLLLLSTDPASAGQQWNQAYSHLRQLLSAQGSYYPIDEKTFNTLMYNIVAKKWTDQQVQLVGGQYVRLVNGRMTGDAQTQYADALNYAYTQGVTMSDSWYQTQIRKVEQGLLTADDLKAAIKNQAIAQFPGFSQQIQGGQTVQDLASPYIQQMANILEVNGNALSAFDPTIKKALTYKDPTSGQTTGQPLWQFENTLRQDPRWLQTNNARDSMMTAAHGILQEFGMSI